MRLNYLSYDDQEILKKVVQRVGTELFHHKEVSDIVPSQQYLKKLAYRGYITDEGRTPKSRVHYWKLADKIVEQMGGSS